MPYRPTERQYRNFAASNFHALNDEESTEPSYRVKGYFTNLISTIQSIHFKGRQAPTISGSAFGSVKPATIIFDGLPPSDTTASLDNLSASFSNSSTTHAHTFYASKKIGNGAWLALASPLVSTEVSHAPAGNFGVYKRGNYHVAWFMPRKSPYEIQGIKVIVR